MKYLLTLLALVANLSFAENVNITRTFTQVEDHIYEVTVDYKDSTQLDTFGLGIATKIEGDYLYVKGSGIWSESETHLTDEDDGFEQVNFKYKADMSSVDFYLKEVKAGESGFVKFKLYDISTPVAAGEVSTRRIRSTSGSGVSPN